MFCSEFLNIPDERWQSHKKIRRIIIRRRTQTIAKGFSFHANTIKEDMYVFYGSGINLVIEVLR